MAHVGVILSGCGVFDEQGNCTDEQAKAGLGRVGRTLAEMAGALVRGR